MKVLTCLPHFYGSATPGGSANLGSSSETADQRALNIGASLRRLSTILSEKVLYAGTTGLSQQGGGIICFDQINTLQRRVSGDIYVCTDEVNHLSGAISTGTIAKQHVSKRPPQELGYACRDLFRELQDEYDLFCFMEDDISVFDESFFEKFADFYNSNDDSYVLSPNRYELWGKMDVSWKVYLEGSEPPQHRVRLYHDAPKAIIQESMHGKVEHWLAPNLYSASFVITRSQLKSWIKQEDYNKPSDKYPGSLLVMELVQIPMGGYLPIYKPSPKNPSFLEVHHSPNRLINSKTPWNGVLQRVRDEMDRKNNRRVPSV